MSNSIICAALLLLSSLAVMAETDEIKSSGYVDIRIDRLVIDSERLTSSSQQLSNSIIQLSESIRQLSERGGEFSEQDRATIIAATQSVDSASRSISELARQIPLTAKALSDHLPLAIEQSQVSIQRITDSIAAANEAVLRINESFPQVVTRSEALVDRLLDSALQKISFYALILLVLLLLTLAALIFYSHRMLVQPALELLAEFKIIPAQMSIMSRQMMQTSENLLRLRSPKKVRRPVKKVVN